MRISTPFARHVETIDRVVGAGARRRAPAVVCPAPSGRAGLAEARQRAAGAVPAVAAGPDSGRTAGDRRRRRSGAGAAGGALDAVETACPTARRAGAPLRRSVAPRRGREPAQPLSPAIPGAAKLFTARAVAWAARHAMAAEKHGARAQSTA